MLREHIPFGTTQEKSANPRSFAVVCTRNNPAPIPGGQLLELLFI
jgi:hypothetical protein